LAQLLPSTFLKVAEKDWGRQQI